MLIRNLHILNWRQKHQAMTRRVESLTTIRHWNAAAKATFENSGGGNAHQSFALHRESDRDYSWRELPPAA